MLSAFCLTGFVVSTIDTRRLLPFAQPVTRPDIMLCSLGGVVINDMTICDLGLRQYTCLYYTIVVQCGTFSSTACIQWQSSPGLIEYDMICVTANTHTLSM